MSILGQARQMFLDLLPERTEQLTQAIDAADFGTIRAVAHLIAGSAGCLGLTAIGTQAKGVELAALRRQLPDILEEFEKLRARCSEVMTPVLKSELELT